MVKSGDPALIWCDNLNLIDLNL